MVRLSIPKSVLTQNRFGYGGGVIRPGCENRPSDIKVDTQCKEQGITKANYYYRLRHVWEVFLELCESFPFRVELTMSVDYISAKVSKLHSSVVAVFHTGDGITVDLYDGDSAEFFINPIGVTNYAERCFWISENMSCYRIHGFAHRHGRAGEYHVLLDLHPNSYHRNMHEMSSLF